MDDNGQAALAPVDPFADLVGLLESDPTSDAATDAPGRELADANNPALAGLDADNQGGELDPGEEDPDYMADDQVGHLDPDRSLSPNGGRRAVQPQDGTQKQAPAAADRQGKGKTFTVTVKGDDGTEQTLEVDEKERGAGYLRHDRFTKAMQELSVQRAQVVEVADNKIQGYHKTALDAVQRASAIITRLAGFQTPEQMAALAASDPPAYNAEHARVTAVREQIKALDDEAARIIESGKKEAEERLQAAYTACWSELQRMGLIERTADGRVTPDSEKKLRTVFEKVISRFGIPASRFATINDPKLIAMMFEAVEMGDLKERAKTLKEQLKNDPKAAKPRANVPTQRQHQPRQQQVNRDLEGRFSSRRGASTNELARWIANNNA